VYNHFLSKRVKDYKETKKGSSYLRDAMQLPILKETLTWLEEVGSQSLQYSVKCLQRAYENFFAKRTKFPKRKKRHRRDSFHIAQNVKVIDGKLVIPKFQEGIVINLHRPLIGEIRHATISKKVGKYQVAICVNKVMPKLPKNNKEIGLDLNVKDIVDNKGNKYNNPRPRKQYEPRLTLAHKKVSRRKKGSNGKRKAYALLAKLYHKTRNIREDYLHKLSKRIVDENQVICVEDLCVKDMVRKCKPDERKEPRWQEKKRHKDILDCGFYSFVCKLTYKALWYGRTLLKCDRWFPSSQLCNHCNWRNKDLQPTERIWTCWNCFENNDRDVNSAKNVKDDCLRTAGNAGIAVRPLVRPGLLPFKRTMGVVVRNR
jgi:putative transposase